MIARLPKLLVITSARVGMAGDEFAFDVKFVEGMRQYTRTWFGDVECVIRLGERLPFARAYSIEELPFSVKIIEDREFVDGHCLEGASVVLCEGDTHENLHVYKMARDLGIKFVYTIEYTLETRLRIAIFDASRCILRRMYSLVWIVFQEVRRRRALAGADGVQANGYPVFDAYRRLNANTMIYLDSRIHAEILATDAEMADRLDWVLRGEPLRLVHSGRLEAHKGSQDLIPLAVELRDRGVRFTLDIFGTGALEGSIRSEIQARGLGRFVTVHGVLDFETELVPFARSNCDIYISCHRQSDPSCTYLESMGCGLAVIGYANEMWAKLCSASGAGWLAPLGSVRLLAAAVVEADKNRAIAADRMRSARRFAARHAFELEFERRVRHLNDVMNQSPTHVA